MAKGGPEQSMGQQGQSQSMAPQGMPQQTQGLGALQNAYSQFQNSAPPQPNPMFGQQPSGMQQGNLQGAPLGGGMPQQNPTQQQMQAMHYMNQQYGRPDNAPMGAQIMGTGVGAPLGGGMPQQNPTQQQMQQNQQVAQDFMRQQNPMRLPMMPQAPNFGQIGQEDPRMQAMRHMQRYRGGQ